MKRRLTLLLVLCLTNMLVFSASASDYTYTEPEKIVKMPRSAPAEKGMTLIRTVNVNSGELVTEPVTFQ